MSCHICHHKDCYSLAFVQSTWVCRWHKLNAYTTSVFQHFQWTGTLCSNFDCSRKLCLLGDSLGPKGPKFEVEVREQERERDSWESSPNGVWVDPWPQIHFGPTKSLENAFSGRKCRAQFNFFYWAPAEPFDTTGGTLSFHGTPVEKHWHTDIHLA